MNIDENQNNKSTILIVDDLPNNLRLLSTMLSSQGYKVRSLISGKMALAAAQAAPPDLILLDINMPEMNGYEVCEYLKANEETCEIPIIFISALDEVLDKVKAFLVGGVDYITKPFQIQEVVARIENQLHQQRLKKQLQKQNQRLQQEIRERQRAEQEIRLLLTTTQAISEAPDFHSALSFTLRLVCENIDWDFAEAWIPNEDNTVLECSPAWYGKGEELEVMLGEFPYSSGESIPSKLDNKHHFEEINWEQPRIDKQNYSPIHKFRYYSKRLTFSPNIGLAGRIWLSKQPEWIKDICMGGNKVFVRSEEALEAGFKTCFGVPILAGDRVLAILIFFKFESSQEDRRLIELVSAVATQLGSLIQRKISEEALSLAEERYHSIVENAVDGIFQSTPQGRYISANLALARIYGYNSPEELILSLKDISHQLYVDPSRRHEFMLNMQEDNAIFGFESMVYRKDKSIIWISENARTVRDSKGRILYYEGTVADITARKVAQEALLFQQEQAEKLLFNILPEPIARRLKNDQNTIADSYENVSVLFADLVGFTELSTRKSPTEIVEILNVIFSKFDHLAQQHGLEKIKTIGDAYMVVSGLPISRQDHAEAIAEMALDIQSEMNSINELTGESLSIRIGINSGPVVAGVIGIKKFIYDLWGDTVNIASRMESQGLADAIQVTENTYNLLSSKYCFQKRGTLSIKGKGEMITYFLEGRK